MAYSDGPKVLIRRGGITGRVFAVTKWRDLGNGRIEAIEKHDVTPDYLSLLTEGDVRVVVKALADNIESVELTDEEAAALHRLADATGLCSSTCEGGS